ncbi:nucleoside triphosphate pyrophosphohydrolase [Prauserella marina]|uniref:XTP/dITP diphosphohydrolase n=1 Tax=Prauserella marina TaxID=530584 RepID=A0A222VVW3_9PSEU|nr:MazG family protein [Prauserella marina]ASR38044.1 nucleoside triphosphate pyrophosphohydrolase [Prauserella marina]PWV73282.1 XTP/dITP diphosphohydrolase [Prauserella marina]SDD67384.1 XTP/dITP diphosphohydrolase [Prauserella marina]
MTWSSATVVLVSRALPAVLPAAALSALRSAEYVFASTDLPEETRAALDVKRAPEPAELLALPGVVLVAASETDECAAALVTSGAVVLSAPVPPLVKAADVMDRLRSPGGCPWDAVQTHTSLRQYLVEETFELLDAIEDGDRAAMREELGDVLLQVLFHARVAAEDEAPFDIDDVADDLVTKLVGRHPHVFAKGERVNTVEHQQQRWEELKQTEKRRESIVDGVAAGQPAAALAGKLGQRTGRVGLPFDLFPSGGDEGAKLFRIAAAARRAGVDPEVALRAVAREFAERVRTAEAAAKAAGFDPTGLDADGWRRFWPA